MGVKDGADSRAEGHDTEAADAKVNSEGMGDRVGRKGMDREGKICG